MLLYLCPRKPCVMYRVTSFAPPLFPTAYVQRVSAAYPGLLNISSNSVFQRSLMYHTLGAPVSPFVYPGRKPFHSAFDSIVLSPRQHFRPKTARITPHAALHPSTRMMLHGTQFKWVRGFSWYLMTRRGLPLCLPEAMTWTKIKNRLLSIKDHVLHGLHWTKQGFRVFGANVKVSTLLLKKKIQGKPLSYREHKFLIRTTHDLLKLIPFCFFIIVPFAELLLPAVLWIFPGMLPSTFANQTNDQSQLERKLQAKQYLTRFFQELMAEHTRQILDKNPSERLKYKILMLQEFQNKLISKAQDQTAIGSPSSSFSSETLASHSPHTLSLNASHHSKTGRLFLSVQDTLNYAKLFREEFQLEKLSTQALLVLCEMLGLHPYRIRANIILQLRYHILRLQQEDRHLLWEGLDTLTLEELRDACRDRAMKFYDISAEDMREQLMEWLELSSHRDVSPLLLLWSRSITMMHFSTHQSQGVALSDKAIDQYSMTAEDFLPLLNSSDPALAATGEKKTPQQIFQVKTMKDKLLELNQHLDALQDLAQNLEQEEHLITEQQEHSGSSSLDTPMESCALSVSRADEDHTNDTQSYKDLNHLNKVLIKELQVFRSAARLHHKRTELLLQSIASIIDIYYSKKRQIRPALSQRMLESFMKYLERIVASYSSGVQQASNFLEEAKDNLTLESGEQDEALKKNLMFPQDRTSDLIKVTDRHR